MSSGQAAILLPTAVAAVQGEAAGGAPSAVAAAQSEAETAMEERGAAGLISSLARHDVLRDLVPPMRPSATNERKAPTFDDCSADVRGRGESKRGTER